MLRGHNEAPTGIISSTITLNFSLTMPVRLRSDRKLESYLSPTCKTLKFFNTLFQNQKICSNLTWTVNCLALNNSYIFVMLEMLPCKMACMLLDRIVSILKTF